MYNVIIPAVASLASGLVPTKPTDMADSICIPYNAPQKKAFFCGQEESKAVWNKWDSYTYTSSAQVYV